MPKKTIKKTVKKRIIKRKPTTKKKTLIKRKITKKPITFTNKIQTFKTTPNSFQTVSTTFITTSNQPWVIIKQLCESGIKFHRDFHETKPCDTELSRRLTEIEKLARSHNFINEILHILRSKQSLLERLKQILKYANRKII